MEKRHWGSELKIDIRGTLLFIGRRFKPFIQDRKANLFFYLHPETAVSGDLTLSAVAPIIRGMSRSLGIDTKR
jgi:hypothetical protein